jgi:hypothetical protein
MDGAAFMIFGCSDRPFDYFQKHAMICDNMGKIMKNKEITDAQIRNKMIVIRGKSVLLDSDIAAAYGVETREINQAVKNNPDKFPKGYIIPLDTESKKELIKNFDKFKNIKNYPGTPKAFTEKGLYMLATILKSPQATATTIASIEAFAQIRELQGTMRQLSQVKEEDKQKALMQRCGQVMSELLAPGIPVTGTETTFEINLALMKIKHTIKKGKK